MGLLALSIQILRINGSHSEVLVSSTMGNYTILLLLVSKKMDYHVHSPRCTMGDQQIVATRLSS
jgi:hypothetical protein